MNQHRRRRMNQVHTTPELTKLATGAHPKFLGSSDQKASPNLFDEEDTREDVASHRQLTNPDMQKKYAKPETWTPAPAPSPPPPGCRPMEIAGYQC